MINLDDFGVLKTLDPATGADPHGPRARAALQRILRTRPDSAPAPARPRRRFAGRIAAGVGLVAATTAAVVVVPPVLGGDRAFATWTPRPAGLSATDQARAAEECRDRQAEGSPEHAAELAAAGPAIAERRGTWNLVVLAGGAGFSALCVSDSSKPFFRDYFGMIGTTPPTARPGPRDLTATALGTGAIDQKELSVAVGLAGAEVEAVRYASRSHGDVDATVRSGQFALWLPGDDLARFGTGSVPLEVTYRDGSTATVRVDL